mgnify:CR=1 FL=1|nr:MAG TPA: hypothetical protein [Caudoviricetes sp.]
MQILEIKKRPNGSHLNQTCHGELFEGWALIPDDMELPNFPFGEVIAEEDKETGMMTVTEWIPGELPETPEIPKDTTIPDLQKENILLKAQIQAMSERSDFIEDCIAEMATKVY